MNEVTEIKKWPERDVSGAKRANIRISYSLPDWFVGYGKDESCIFEGSWWDMVCFARNVLASENTKLACPEYYHPEYKNDHYTEPAPYNFTGQVSKNSMEPAESGLWWYRTTSGEDDTE